MSKTNFSKYCKYGAYKFQSFFDKIFQIFCDCDYGLIHMHFLYEFSYSI